MKPCMVKIQKIIDSRDWSAAIFELDQNFPYLPLRFVQKKAREILSGARTDEMIAVLRYVAEKEGFSYLFFRCNPLRLGIRLRWRVCRRLTLLIKVTAIAVMAASAVCFANPDLFPIAETISELTRGW